VPGVEQYMANLRSLCSRLDDMVSCDRGHSSRRDKAGRHRRRPQQCHGILKGRAGRSMRSGHQCINCDPTDLRLRRPPQRALSLCAGGRISQTVLRLWPS
jgi:hypothetical protein